MNELRWETWAVRIAFVISLVFIWVPGPYAMGAFTFIAQPLFFVALISYVAKVLQELRKRKIV